MYARFGSDRLGGQPHLCANPPVGDAGDCHHCVAVAAGAGLSLLQVEKNWGVEVLPRRKLTLGVEAELLPWRLTSGGLLILISVLFPGRWARRLKSQKRSEGDVGR